MIIFDLSCFQNHSFEGWFKSQQDYDEQLASRLIACPHCGSAEVRRVPSALHLAKPTNSQAQDLSTPVIDTQTEMRAAYRQLMTAMMASSEDVGNSFASEARKIHYCEAPERSIRGEASSDDCEALREEGIEVFALPQTKIENLN